MDITRRHFLTLAASGFVAASFPSTRAFSAASKPLATRVIPSSGEQIPVIGMGTWRTFNVGSDERLRKNRLEVLKTFYEWGGGMVDSSPMYGSAEDVMGWCHAKLGKPTELFSATKVWTRGRENGISEMETSRKLWRLPAFDLMQIHNLLDWEVHLETLKEMKASGQARYIGITTSHGRFHSELEQIMKTEPIDFVQLTYNVLDREVEERLLPLAQEKGIAIIVNRPFQRDSLFDHIADAQLPAWAAEFDAENWAQLLLKFVISHPAVTCVIPATSQVEHMVENMGAGHGRLPDAQQRQRIINHVEQL